MPPQNPNTKKTCKDGVSKHRSSPNIRDSALVLGGGGVPVFTTMKSICSQAQVVCHFIFNPFTLLLPSGLSSLNTCVHFHAHLPTVCQGCNHQPCKLHWDSDQDFPSPPPLSKRKPLHDQSELGCVLRDQCPAGLTPMA